MNTRMNIAKSLYDDLSQKAKRLACVEHERNNLRKAYEEVNARSEQQATHYKRQIEDLTRILQNAQASNQHLSQEHAKALKLTGRFVLEKDAMAEANRKLVDLLSYAVDNYNRLAAESIPLVKEAR